MLVVHTVQHCTHCTTQCLQRQVFGCLETLEKWPENLLNNCEDDVVLKTTSKEKRTKKEGRTTAARLEKSGGKFASWKSQKRPTATSESGSTPTDPINLSSTFGGKFEKQKVWSRFYPSRCRCPLSVHADGYFPNSRAGIHWKAYTVVASYASIEARTVRFHNRGLWPI